MGREWQRYEGTPQRDLFRQLRERFLDRHAASEGWVADIGSGPGRFSNRLGASPTRIVLLDLARPALRRAQQNLRPGEPGPFPRYSFVRGDAVRPPLREGAFARVVALGNPLGFSGEGAERFLEAMLPRVAPGGTLLLEAVAGSGERSRYLARLPPGAVRRTLAAPINLLRRRVDREGFRAQPAAAVSPEFRRFSPDDLVGLLAQRGFEVRETMAVAPALGLEPERVAAVRAEPSAWRHLLELEEVLGRQPDRLAGAAAYLVAAVRTGPGAPLGTSRARSAGTGPKRAIK